MKKFQALAPAFDGLRLIRAGEIIESKTTPEFGRFVEVATAAKPVEGAVIEAPQQAQPPARRGRPPKQREQSEGTEPEDDAVEGEKNPEDPGIGV